jgi:hypothetical protein
VTEHSSFAGCTDSPTREDVQELRQSIESLRDHVQIVWQAIDEVREVIEQTLGHDAAEFWNVEPPDGLPLGRFRPFAGYGPFDQDNAPCVDGTDADQEADTEFVADSTETAPSIHGTHHQNGRELSGHQHQRNLWDAPVPEPIEHAPSAEADTTPQKEAEPVAWLLRPDRQTDFGGLPQYEWPAAEEDRDSICVDRIYADPADGTTHRFTIRRGDTVEVFFAKDRLEIGTVVGISQAKGEARVQFDGRGEGVWFYKGKIYPAQQAGEPETQLDNVPQSAEAAGEAYTLDDWIAFRHAFSDGHVDAAGIHDEFRRLQAAKQHFIAELVKAKSADELRLMALHHGHLDARRNTKPQNAESVYRSCLTAFTLGESVYYQPMQETYEEAIERIVLAMTDETIAREREKSRREREAKEKALTNPETYAELSQFVSRKGTDQLSDEQLATWDRLNADISRNARKQKQKATVKQFQSAEIEGATFRIIEGFHDREQVPLWIVQLTNRVERATFNELKIKASQLGGWWSSFRKDSAGFQFRSQESAEKFAGLAEGDADRSDELADRKLRKMDNASDRLNAVASSLEEKAAEVLAADDDKLKNTVRRADMAASMRAQAYTDQADAKTLRSIATALAAGDATYLDGIWNAAQVRTLATILRQARRERINRRLTEEGSDRRTHGWSNRYDELEAEPLSAADARFATFPKPYLYRNHLVQAFAQLGNTPGVKKATAKMRKLVESAPKNQDFVEFVNDYQIELLEDFLARAKAAGSRIWWFDHCLNSYKRLRSAHIDDNHELRTALRELVPHLAHAAGDDPVTRAEDEHRGKDLPGFFPTPRPIIEQMLASAAIEPTHRVLEPSCGKGDILDAIRRGYPDIDLTAVERNLTLQGVLAAKGYEDIVEYSDFLVHHGEYDRVLMNPPFEVGADMLHIRHAYNLLAAGGRLVAIASEHGFFANDFKSVGFRRWLEETAAVVEPLPNDAFNGVDAFRQTGVKTRLVIIDKP